MPLVTSVCYIRASDSLCDFVRVKKFIVTLHYITLHYITLQVMLRCAAAEIDAKHGKAGIAVSARQ